MRQKHLTIITILILVNLLLAWRVYAGSPEPAGPPETTSSYTLADLHNRLNDGTTGSQSTFSEPNTAPGESTMPTLNDIMAQAPAVDEANGAEIADVANGKTYWSLRNGEWGQQTGTGILASGNAQAGNVLAGTTFSNSTAAGLTGTMSNRGAYNITPGLNTATIPHGYHNGQGTVAGDNDLMADNIREGVNLFGINGTLVSGAIPVQSTVPRTGQIICWSAASPVAVDCSGTGQDGEYQMGTDAVLTPSTGKTGAYTVPAWSGERFTDNGDGTVRDNMTGLVWLKDANCYGHRTWDTALLLTSILEDGSCGLSDGSTGGDWRLPNINELHSLIDLSQSDPALPVGHPFIDVQSSAAYSYWSSTNTSNVYRAWAVLLKTGYVSDSTSKTTPRNVWPVRGG